jgi:hypothetical protein
MAGDTGLIKQSERLLTVRPRGFAFPQEDGGSRGTRSRIRILSSDPSRALAQRSSENQSLSGNVNGLNVFNDLYSLDSNGGFKDFLLTDVNVSFNEKVQITQTFGDTETVYYFGRAPVIYNISGLLIDDLDNQWFTQFVDLYGGVLRGTESARNYELIEFTLPNVLLVGTIMTFSYTQNAARDTDIQFSMQIHAKSIVPLPTRIPGQIPTSILGVIDFGKAASFTTFAEINDIKDKAAAAAAAAAEQAAFDDPELQIQRDVAALTALDNASARNGNAGAALSSGDVAVTTPAEFQASIFSPVFGVLTTITKVVKTTTGDISKIISSFTKPVNDVLRDIQGITTQAIGIVHAVENGINRAVSDILRPINELHNTIIALKNAAGVISRAPETIGQSLKRLVKIGKISSSAVFLNAGGAAPGSKTALLKSGAPYNPSTAGRLRR